MITIGVTEGYFTELALEKVIKVIVSATYIAGLIIQIYLLFIVLLFYLNEPDSIFNFEKLSPAVRALV